jgi:hypothetical protein
VRDRVEGCCRLCQAQTALVDSHIIPNFHFKKMKGEDHWFHVLSSDPNKPELKRQGAITEHLLCDDCDNKRLSRYENHVRQVLFGGIPIESVLDGRVRTFKGYDYKKLKNGLLSVLWRMSLSSDPYFSNVDLGEKHSERIRSVLLNDEELPEELYPVILTAPVFEGKLFGDCILRPTFARTNGNRVYRCVISGLIFTFVVGAAPLDKNTQRVILRREEWPTLYAKTEEIPFLHAAILELSRACLTRANSS